MSPDLTAAAPAFRTARLDAIDRALEEMSGSHYGVCARCGDLIDVERLRVTPDSHACAKCALAAAPVD